MNIHREGSGSHVHADPEAFIGLLSTSLDLEARRDAERHVVLSRRP